MKYVISVIGIVLALFVVIIILISGGSGSKAAKPTTTTSLVDYNKSSTSVSFTTQGPIVGDEDYREIRITISQSKRVVQILKGYNQNVIKAQTFSNNEKAYQVFLAALDLAGFRSEKKSTIGDYSGTCSQGDRFIYKLTDNNKDIENTWANSCISRQGTFAGITSDVESLFQAQISNYSDITADVQI